MANVESNAGVFEDFGSFKSGECKEILETSVCEIKFKLGRITLLESELKKICKEV